MTNKLKWRLVKLPTSEEVTKLVNDKIITKEEAREILFSEEIENEKSVDDLKQEIKFLKELVEKLSNNNRSQIVETIRYIEKPYYNWGWYQPYQIYCSNSDNTLIGNGTTYVSGSSALNAVATSVNFSAIS